MEEILASIRRIISEDEAPPAESEEAVAAPEPEPASEPELEAEPEFGPEPEPESEPEPLPEPVAEAPAAVETIEDDEVLELTDRVEAAPAPAETHGDIDVYPVESEPEFEAPAAPEPRAAADDVLVGKVAAESAASAFGQLAKTVAMPAEGRNLEDVVRELLRPLLKAWLDEHLPGIVQAKVEAEVERIARGRAR